MPSSDNDERLSASSVLSHLGVMVAISAVLGLLAAGLAIPYVTALGATSKDATQGLSDLPKAMTAAPLAQKSRLLSRGGKVIATFYGEDQNRTSVSFDQISPTMRKAIVAIEDYRFYQHGALDLKGTLRAFLTNKASGGDVVQGGSSITQQMAKMTQLNQAKTAAERKAATADTYQRKILELRHAIGFEQKYSKNWILTRYLNLAYFGDGAYGIQAASRHYFSKDAKDLDLRESSLLAGLVKNPVGYDPTDDPAAAKKRRQIVLDRMAELKIISRDVASRIGGESLGLKITKTRNGCVSSVAPFFCDYAYRYLLADKSLGKTRDERRQLINTGGLTIKSTIDLDYQKASRDAVAQHVFATDQAIGALAMVEPGTGNVRAVAQSRPMGRDRKAGQTFLNYVVPSSLGDSAGFQGGSTFKVFVLAAALEDGMNPRTPIPSPNQVHLPVNSFPDCTGNYSGTQIWEPSNSTQAPPAPDMYTGTQDSVNTFYAKLTQRTGLCKPYELAKKMGVELTDPTHERVPSFVLGVPSVSPLEMAGAYATFAARGMHCDPKPISSILNADGKLFKRYAPECKRVISENTADTVNDILRGVMQPGGFGQALAVPGHVSGGKTGTIQNNAAVWFDGYTPAISTVAMVAGANSLGKPITLNYQSVGGVSAGRAFGSTVAGPIWGDAMRAIADKLPIEDFFRPTAIGTIPSTPDTSSQGPQGTAQGTVQGTAQGGTTQGGTGQGDAAPPSGDASAPAATARGRGDGGTNNRRGTGNGGGGQR